MLKASRAFILIFIIQMAMAPLPADWVAADELGGVLVAGRQALERKDFKAAERFFSRALAMEPGNYDVLRSLSEIKIKLEKFAEAEPLLDRILKMPSTSGRNIWVYIPGDAEPHEAEMVDETVMAVDENAEAQPADKFVKDFEIIRVPHYRVYFKKTGKMKVLLKSNTRIRYDGIPTATREQVAALKAQVQKKIIAALDVKSGQELVSIAGGCFQMGSNVGDLDEKPVHEVCLSPFRIHKYEVSQKYFQSVTGTNPSENIGADLPVDSVTWDEARDYCKTIGLRLPTEAEWEFAARAGTTTEFYWGDHVTGKEANFCDRGCEMNLRELRVMDGFKKTAPVGSFPPNPYGLHDMAGNVAEWVRDWMDVAQNYYLISPKNDPLGTRPELNACMAVDCVAPASIGQKIIRGGAWNLRVSTMRSANRHDAHFQLRLDGTGFRCALGVDALKITPSN